MSIADLIAAAGDRLTPTDRRIAESLLDDPALAVFGTVSDLADRTGVSRPSVVRFATKLGFEGFTDLQRQARAGVADKLVTPARRIRRLPDERDAVREAISRSTGSTLDALAPARLRSMARPLVEAERIWILSGETSRAGATVLASGLAMVRPDVRLIDQHDLGRDLSLASDRDAAVVFDFARYRSAVLAGTAILAERGVTVVAITDGPLSPLVPHAAVWCQLSVPAVGPFDSSVPAVFAAELLVQEAVRQFGDEAERRIDHLEQLWSQTGTFLPDQ